MSALPQHLPASLPGSLLRAAHTILSCGLNVAVSKVRDSRYARILLALVILNEIRGLYIVYNAANYGLLPWLS